MAGRSAAGGWSPSAGLRRRRPPREPLRRRGAFFVVSVAPPSSPEVGARESVSEAVFSLESLEEPSPMRAPKLGSVVGPEWSNCVMLLRSALPGGSGFDSGRGPPRAAIDRSRSVAARRCALRARPERALGGSPSRDGSPRPGSCEGELRERVAGPRDLAKGRGAQECTSVNGVVRHPGENSAGMCGPRSWRRFGQADPGGTGPTSSRAGREAQGSTPDVRVWSPIDPRLGTPKGEMSPDSGPAPPPKPSGGAAGQSEKPRPGQVSPRRAGRRARRSGPPCPRSHRPGLPCGVPAPVAGAAPGPRGSARWSGSGRSSGCAGRGCATCT